jgi:hypothetical protein
LSTAAVLFWAFNIATSVHEKVSLIKIGTYLLKKTYEKDTIPITAQAALMRKKAAGK